MCYYVSVICLWRCRNVNFPVAGIQTQVAVLTTISPLPLKLEARFVCIQFHLIPLIICQTFYWLCWLLKVTDKKNKRVRVILWLSVVPASKALNIGAFGWDLTDTDLNPPNMRCLIFSMDIHLYSHKIIHFILRGMAGEDQRRRWSLQGKTALVTGGTKGIGFVNPLLSPYILKAQWLDSS